MPLFTRPLDISRIDPANILKTSHNNKCPFNVPTLVLMPEEFESFVKKEGRLLKFSRADMQSHIKVRLKELFNHDTHLSHQQIDTIAKAYLKEASEPIITEMASNIALPQHIQSGCIPYPFMSINGPFAHQAASREHYKEPITSVVFTFSEAVDGKFYGESMMSLKEDELPDMPGSSEEWRFMLLWHEFAHTTGAAEPNADKMAAIITRQAFGRNDIIQALADQRMVTAILEHHSDIAVSYYGLPLIENLDEVAAMSQDKIDNLNKQAIIDIRFNQYDYKSDKMVAFGKALEKPLSHLFESVRKKSKPLTMNDLIDLKNEAERLIDDGHFKTNPEMDSIAQRFILAITRLSVGKPAYNAKSPHI